MSPHTSPASASPALPAWLGRALEQLTRPTDVASLAAFRVLFGVLMMAGSGRFLASGFLDKLYCDDATYLRYPFLSWVPVPTPNVIALIYATFIVLGALIALGAVYRIAMAGFVVLFVWVKLTDVTNYLNHDVLVALLGALMVIAPAHHLWSVDAWRAARRGVVLPSTTPLLTVVVLRFQVASVFVFAAIAKIGSDWLIDGQPLELWLWPKTELPLIGPMLALAPVPLILSWCGFLYDATIVPLLLWSRTRRAAYLCVLLFHGLTSVFFSIGMFPYIMAVATTLMFSPAWPRAVLSRLRVPHRPPANTRHHVPRALWFLTALYLCIALLVPLRAFVLSDNVLWDETGMRFSWRVMVREKSGTLTYVVRHVDGREVFVSPHDHLTPRQVNELIGQPDMIVTLAHIIRDQHAARGEVVQVRADARAAINGRPLARFIDPNVDLAAVDHTVLRPSYVLPAPTSAPPSRGSLRALWSTVTGSPSTSDGPR